MQGNKRHTNVKNRLLDYVGEGEGGMIREKSIETCTLPCVKQMTSASSMHEAGTQSRCSGTTQRGGVGWAGGRERRSGWGTHVNPWLIHVGVWQKPPQYCKVITLQLK